MWIKRVAASGGLLFRGRHSLVSPSLLYILGVRWNKARGQSSTRQGAFDKKGRSFFVTNSFSFLCYSASWCFMFLSILRIVSVDLAPKFDPSLKLWMFASPGQSWCVLPSSVVLMAYRFNTFFSHAGPFIKFLTTHKNCFCTQKPLGPLVVFCFQVLSRWYEVGEPKMQVNHFVRSSAFFPPSFHPNPSEPDQGLRCSTLPSRAGSFVGWPREETNSSRKLVEWHETETHTWKINNQETRQTFIHYESMKLCTCHWCHYSTPLLNSVRGPLSACLKITDPPCQHGLDIFGFDETPDFRFQIRFVSVPGWMSPSRLGATIHQSIPQASRPSSPGKMSPGGCDHGGAWNTTGIYACATCAHDASGVCGPCGADPISRVTWKDCCCFGFGFLHLTTWFTATNFSGSWKIDLSLFSGWKYVKHHL